MLVLLRYKVASYTKKFFVGCLRHRRIYHVLNQKNEELSHLLEEKNKELEVNSSEEQYKELENSFFDLQMENIRLKGELEKLRS